MELKEHLRELRPHAEWKLLEMLGEWLHEKALGDTARAGMYLLIGAVAQRIQGVPYDLWILAFIFLGSLVLLAYSYVRDHKTRIVDGQITPIEVDSSESKEGNKPSLALSQTAATSTTIDTGQAPPAVIFVVEESWLDRTPGAKFPLELRTRWINEGDEVHVGKPQWIAEKMPLQGNALRYKFKVGNYGTECDETSIKHGEQCEIWLGLNPDSEQRQVEDWRRDHQLGTLILSVMVGRVTRGIRVRL